MISTYYTIELGRSWLTRSVAASLLAVSVCTPLPASADSGLLPLDVQPRRETEATPERPFISFIDSPTTTCYGPLEAVDVCYIQWSSLSVSATSPQHMERMTVAIDGRVRAVYAGFFQTSMYVPPEMHAEGFKVACGSAGASGDADSGFHYPVEIKARESGGLTAANYGTAICPAEYRLYPIFSDGFE